MQHWDSLCGFVEGDEVHVARRAEDAAALAPEQFWRLAPPPKGWEGLRDAI
jgi:hypothetical protein